MDEGGPVRKELVSFENRTVKISGKKKLLNDRFEVYTVQNECAIENSKKKISERSIGYPCMLRLN